MKEIDTNNIKSILELKKIYIKQFNFERNEEIDNIIKSNDLKYKFGKAIDRRSDTDFEITLSVIAESENNFHLNLSVVGLFYVQDFPKNKVLIYKNSAAILFPYLRSELTLLTSQPDMNPIILPAININAIFDEIQN